MPCIKNQKIWWKGHHSIRSESFFFCVHENAINMSYTRLCVIIDVPIRRLSYEKNTHRLVNDVCHDRM